MISFHIPKEPPGHPVWKARYGNVERSYEHCRLQWEERKALEKHDRVEDCKPIINPYLRYKR